jgi:hypothetical protein
MSKLKEAAARPASGTVGRGLYNLDADGGPTGKTEMDWVNAMGGNPTSIHEMAGGMRLLQWTSGRTDLQRIAVLFDSAHVFVQIASRYRV